MPTLQATEQPRATLTFQVHLTRPLPCGFGGRSATARDGQYRCDRCGTSVEIPEDSFNVLRQARGVR